MLHSWHESSSIEDEVYVTPIEESSLMVNGGWQLLSVSLHRSPQLGFGIAISGGIDNPLFTSGEGTIVISDVVDNGPAAGLLQLNDRILSANGISFESIEYGRAIEVIKHSQHINMIVKRRVAVPLMEYEQRTLKFTLSKSRKKDDFGIVLGCKFFIKEIRNPKLAEKDPGLREGDTVLRVNGQSLDGIGLDEASKWLERSRDKLCLVIQRDVHRGTTRWPSTQTVYERVGSLGATPRHSPSPIMNLPLSARSSHEYINNASWKDNRSDKISSMNGIDQYRNPNSSSSIISQSPYSSSPMDYHFFNNHSTKPDDKGVRIVCFHKVGGSVGIRVIGGNEVGIFVSAVGCDSPAARHGVSPGDRILEVNNHSMNGMTREGAVELLVSLEDRIMLKLEYALSHFEYVRQSQIGDSFFVRCHFNKERKGSSPLEMNINEGDIFHVTDTLFGGTIGLWQASRVYGGNGKNDNGKGVIPNLSSAQSYAREVKRLAEEKECKGRGTLLRRKLESRRSKSLPKNILGDDSNDCVYERVVLNTPTFPRPVILVGPLADIIRRQLISQFALVFTECNGDGVIRLSSIDNIISTSKHCILDITMDSVERLQMAQYAPIVILIDVDSRSKIREIRKKVDAPHISSKTLYEQTAYIKKHYSHLLSATVDASHEDGWLEAVRDLISHLQLRRLWMPELPCSLPLEDVLLFTNKKNEKESEYDRDKSIHSDYVEYCDRRINDMNKSSMYIQWNGLNNEEIMKGRDGISIMDEGRMNRKEANDTLSSNRSISSNIKQNMKLIGRNEMNERGDERKNEKEEEKDNRRMNGYYDMNQLLNDNEENKLVNELIKVGINGKGMVKENELVWRNNRRNEEDKRIEFKNNNEKIIIGDKQNDVEGVKWNESSPFNIPQSSSSSMDKPSIPPKPFISTKDKMNVVRNKWIDHNDDNKEEISNDTSCIQSNSKEEIKDDISSIDDSRIIEQSTSWLGYEGGILSCPVSNVQLIVPIGAISKGDKHEVYIKVCEENTCESSPIDNNRDEQLLSPLVICGPHGLQFNTPVELRLPHCVKEGRGDEWKLSLKTGDGEEWKQMDLSTDTNKPFISLPISKF